MRPVPPACRSILETIGRTPLVHLRRMATAGDARVWAKLEGFNPLGSVKERIALAMIEAAEARGDLKPGMTLLEASSGNTGIGLAMVGAVKGYPVLITMAHAASEERRCMLAALGAEVRLTTPEGDSDEAIAMADALQAATPQRFFRVGQYENPDNPRAHYEGTAQEIWEQSGGSIDWLVLVLGTCGTLVGVSRRLKELKPSIRVVAVEPQPGHEQQGLRNMTEACVPAIMDWSLVDERLEVRDRDAIDTARLLARREGILAGISSGTAVFAALAIAAREKRGDIVTLLPDRGERYFSNDLYPARPAGGAA